MIAVTFALPQESCDFRRELHALRPAAKLDGNWSVGTCGGNEVLVGHTGIGCAAASRALPRALREYRPDFVISAGFAGGLNDSLGLGTLVVATNFSDAALVESAKRLLEGERCSFGLMFTAPSAVETRTDKSRLALATGASAVDMETHAIAAACGEATIPLLALRVISDTASTSLPVPFADWFDLERQRPKPFALIRYLAMHPTRILPFYRFVSGLGPARAELTKALGKLIGTTRELASRRPEAVSGAAP